jgi:hypothetical protein
MSDKTYNGWTNYETWLVKLWMDNDGGSYGHYQDVAQEAASQADKPEDAVPDLADQLKQEYEEAADELLPGEASVWHDLINGALAEVNWYEIAEHMIEEAAEAVAD